MGSGAQLGDVVDVLQNHVVTSQPDRPKSQQGRCRLSGVTGLTARRRVMELVAEGDEALLERWMTSRRRIDE